MGTGHAHPLHRPGNSPVHRLPPEVKIVATVVAVVAIVATPRAAFGAFAGYLVLLAGIWTVAGIPFGWILRRSLIETPFVVLAVLLPLAGDGPRTVWLGVSLSEPGLYGAWNILVKGTL